LIEDILVENHLLINTYNLKLMHDLNKVTFFKEKLTINKIGCFRNKKSDSKSIYTKIN